MEVKTMSDFKILDSDGNTCDGACNSCGEYRFECEAYDGECKINCENCFYWSGGCEA
jgi:hypothetical protein